jgi:hypothetical protein
MECLQGNDRRLPKVAENQSMNVSCQLLQRYLALWGIGNRKQKKTMLNWRQQIMRARELAVNPIAPDSEIDQWQQLLWIGPYHSEAQFKATARERDLEATLLNLNT